MLIQQRGYQELAVDFLLEHKGRGAVRAPTGAGKTIIALKAATKLAPVLTIICVPKFNTILAWRKNIEKIGFANADEIVIIKKWTVSRRQKFWEELRTRSVTPKVIIVLLPTIAKDIEQIMRVPIENTLVIVDESHRIKNRQSQWFKALRRLCRNRMRILLTATPQTKGPQDLWTSLHLCSPKVFTSYWDFVDRYCVIDDDGYSKKVIGVKKKKTRELRERVRNYIYNIPKSVTAGFVPKSVRNTISYELDKKTRRVYNSLNADLLAELPNRELILTPNNLSKTVKLRQLCACPAIVHPALGVGAAFEACLDHAMNNDKHVVFYSEFTECFEHWQKRLDKENIKHFTLKGGMDDVQVENTVRLFEREKNNPNGSILFCSIHFGESFDVMTAETGYFIGFAWSQVPNRQAEGRLTRGDKPYCTFYYAVGEDTIDTQMLDVLNTNISLSSITL